MKIESAALNSIKPESEPVSAPLKKAIQQFESFFIAEMMKEMRKTVPDSGLFGHGQEENMMRDMLDEEWANQMANGRGIGLAKVLYRQLQQQQ
ncbi:MAG: rod-binding protein [Candidatus Sericytochromatia bacterium]